MPLPILAAERRATDPAPLIRRAQPLLGTIVEVAVDPAHEASIDAAFEAIRHVHARMSFHEQGSDLATLARASAGETVAVDPATITVLRAALNLYEQSGGLFDVAIGRELVRTRFLPRDPISHLSSYGGTSADLEIVDDRHVRLARRVLIDLGGIAKGYAVDMAVVALRRAGAAFGVVNAGGDLRLFGDVAIPVTVRHGGGGYAALPDLRNLAVASSENSRTRHRIDGQIRTPHIGLDRASVIIDDTVTVIADTCMIADALTKVAMTDTDLADRILADHDGFVVSHRVMKSA